MNKNGWGASGRGWERGGGRERGTGSGKVGRVREAQSARRMNGNMQPQKVGGRKALWKVPETWEVRDSQDSMGVTLDAQQ